MFRCVKKNQNVRKIVLFAKGLAQAHPGLKLHPATALVTFAECRSRFQEDDDKCSLDF